MAEMCRLLGGMTEELGKYAAALSYYRTAMKNAKLVTPISRRCFIGVDILDRIAECYSRLGKFEDAERTFNKAIKVYEKYQGHASLSQPGRDNDRRNQALMEIKVMHVYLHYAQTLNLMNRSSEVSLIRQRLVHLLQGSPMLRGEETHVLDQFDDILTRQRQLLGGGNKGSDKSV
ncbi:hypothetical protein BBJ29_000786 [Phytophthora kernoviae]|uniref:Uncharacterized protein n=1 Tax=Phytophthora kernoviae TaxID=325452 RepID=A0A3F2S2L4_9STRA|nr:hypothetical protein BBJ29_000786 [Phytophthora kernoviae]RLN68301.1 hypothetical protein BBP00_00001082 [Phytophthora kernoviae]